MEQRAPTVLVLDDEQAFRKALARNLSRQGYEVIEAGTGEEALDIAGHNVVDIALVDLKLPGMSGHEVLQEMQRCSSGTVCIVITGHGDAQAAVDALGDGGAYDYFEKPFLSGRFRGVLRKALEFRALKQETNRLRERLEDFHAEHLTSRSAVMLRLVATIRDVARVPVTVLITGESGTGKERVAKAIHTSSPQASGPWIPVNCSAIPEGLLESELFGHERGAFTGAQARRSGLFEQAQGGTIFLDEIGEMPLSMQAKLLRVLNEREVVRVGGGRPIPVNCRVVAATNIDIGKAVEEGRFRRDLYYRLNVMPIHVPPLRERRQDIQLLAWEFVCRFNREYGKNVRSISQEALDLLVSYDWAQNNVRELENAVGRAMVLARGDVLDVDLFDLPGARRSPAPGVETGRAPFDPSLMDLGFTEAKQQVVERFARWYIGNRLRQTGGNITRAAELSGWKRPNFRRLMDRHGVTPLHHREKIKG